MAGSSVELTLHDGRDEAASVGSAEWRVDLLGLSPQHSWTDQAMAKASRGAGQDACAPRIPESGLDELDDLDDELGGIFSDSSDSDQDYGAEAPARAVDLQDIFAKMHAKLDAEHAELQLEDAALRTPATPSEASASPGKTAGGQSPTSAFESRGRNMVTPANPRVLSEAYGPEGAATSPAFEERRRRKDPASPPSESRRTRKALTSAYEVEVQLEAKDREIAFLRDARSLSLQTQATNLYLRKRVAELERERSYAAPTAPGLAAVVAASPGYLTPGDPGPRVSASKLDQDPGAAQPAFAVVRAAEDPMLLPPASTTSSPIRAPKALLASPLRGRPHLPTKLKTELTDQAFRVLERQVRDAWDRQQGLERHCLELVEDRDTLAHTTAANKSAAAQRVAALTEALENKTREAANLEDQLRGLREGQVRSDTASQDQEDAVQRYRSDADALQLEVIRLRRELAHATPANDTDATALRERCRILGEQAGEAAKALERQHDAVELGERLVEELRLEITRLKHDNAKAAKRVARRDQKIQKLVDVFQAKDVIVAELQRAHLRLQEELATADLELKQARETDRERQEAIAKLQSRVVDLKRERCEVAEGGRRFEGLVERVQHDLRAKEAENAELRRAQQDTGDAMDHANARLEAQKELLEAGAAESQALRTDAETLRHDTRRLAESLDKLGKQHFQTKAEFAAEQARGEHLAAALATEKEHAAELKDRANDLIAQLQQTRQALDLREATLNAHREEASGKAAELARLQRRYDTSLEEHQATLLRMRDQDDVLRKRQTLVDTSTRDLQLARENHAATVAELERTLRQKEEECRRLRRREEALAQEATDRHGALELEEARVKDLQIAIGRVEEERCTLRTTLVDQDRQLRHTQDALDAANATLEEREESESLLRRENAALRGDVDQGTTRVEKLEATITAKGATLNALQKACDAAETERDHVVDRLAASAEALRNAQSRMAALEKENATLRRVASQRDASAEHDATRARAMESELSVVRSAAADAKEKASALEAALGEKDHRLRMLESATSGAEAEMQRAEGEVQQVWDRLAESDAELATLRTARADLAERLHAAELGRDRLSAERETLEQQMEVLTRDHAAAANRASADAIDQEKLRDHVRSLTGELKTQTAETRALREATQASAGAASQLKALRQECEELHGVVKASTEAMNDMDQELGALREAMARVEARGEASDPGDGEASAIGTPGQPTSAPAPYRGGAIVVARTRGAESGELLDPDVDDGAQDSEADSGRHGKRLGVREAAEDVNALLCQIGSLEGRLATKSAQAAAAEAAATTLSEELSQLRAEAANAQDAQDRAEEAHSRAKAALSRQEKALAEAEDSCAARTEELAELRRTASATEATRVKLLAERHEREAAEEKHRQAMQQQEAELRDRDAKLDEARVALGEQKRLLESKADADADLLNRLATLEAKQEIAKAEHGRMSAAVVDAESAARKAAADLDHARRENQARRRREPPMPALSLAGAALGSIDAVGERAPVDIHLGRMASPAPLQASTAAAPSETLAASLLRPLSPMPSWPASSASSSPAQTASALDINRGLPAQGERSPGPALGVLLAAYQTKLDAVHQDLSGLMARLVRLAACAEDANSPMVAAVRQLEGRLSRHEEHLGEHRGALEALQEELARSRQLASETAAALAATRTELSESKGVNVLLEGEVELLTRAADAAQQKAAAAQDELGVLLSQLEALESIAVEDEGPPLRDLPMAPLARGPGHAAGVSESIEQMLASLRDSVDADAPGNASTWPSRGIRGTEEIQAKLRLVLHKALGFKEERNRLREHVARLAEAAERAAEDAPEDPETSDAAAGPPRPRIDGADRRSRMETRRTATHDPDASWRSESRSPPARRRRSPWVAPRLCEESEKKACEEPEKKVPQVFDGAALASAGHAHGSAGRGRNTWTDRQAVMGAAVSAAVASASAAQTVATVARHLRRQEQLGAPRFRSGRSGRSGRDTERNEGQGPAARPGRRSPLRNRFEPDPRFDGRFADLCDKVMELVEDEELRKGVLQAVLGE